MGSIAWDCLLVMRDWETIISFNRELFKYTTDVEIFILVTSSDFSLADDLKYALQKKYVGLINFKLLCKNKKICVLYNSVLAKHQLSRIGTIGFLCSSNILTHLYSSFFSQFSRITIYSTRKLKIKGHRCLDFHQRLINL